MTSKCIKFVFDLRLSICLWVEDAVDEVAAKRTFQILVGHNGNAVPESAVAMFGNDEQWSQWEACELRHGDKTQENIRKGDNAGHVVKSYMSRISTISLLTKPFSL